MTDPDSDEPDTSGVDTDGVALDTDALEGWLADHAGTSGPLTATQIAGGRSNLTYRVEDADGQAFVLRRPPLGDLLPGAHDMSREHRVMAALADTDVPVPEMVGISTGPDSVLGADFYVMRFVEGQIVRTAREAESLEPAVRRAAADSLARTMATLHALDPQELGLGERAKGENYLARQLHVWRRQLDAQKGRELPVMDDLHARLTAAIPDQRAVGIVHGDYRLDNVMLADDGSVAAVLDWELWTLGDPLADVAITMSYWTEAEDAAAEIIGRPTTVEGFGNRGDFRRAYHAAGGQEMPDHLVPYYLSFGVWRLAAIIEGVYQRNLAGAYGEQAESVRMFEEYVPAMARDAAAYADEAGI
ncbi:phosphotransferase family protein [Euzebya tangerina]|uniref:phosphotransferase family protein n=1 Tax=Euzebya tangerina TaxID=591198 RepID=UPI000E318FC6|nr:phosphotransferase family protein [Euzebya tangerina]